MSHPVAAIVVTVGAHFVAAPTEIVSALGLTAVMHLCLWVLSWEPER